jgi:hypothetical protein
VVLVVTVLVTLFESLNAAASSAVKVASAVAGAAGAVGAGKLARTFVGAQQRFLRTLKTPEVAVVETTIGYRVLVRKAHAVTGAQLHFTSGYCVVEVPIVITTGILIVAVEGIVCAITKQYLQPFAYEPSGIFITKFVSTTVTEELITILSHNLQL